MENQNVDKQNVGKQNVENQNVKNQNIEKHNMEACLRYFKERQVFRKVFEKIFKKYESLGHFGGTIRLDGLTDAEKEQLGGFLRKDFFGNKTITISVSAMESALTETKFVNLSFKDVLEQYFKEELIGNKEKQEAEQRQREQFFERLKREAGTPEQSDWIELCVEQKNVVYKEFFTACIENEAQCFAQMEVIFRAGRLLPVLQNQTEALPVFATKITGNPHYFDEGTKANRLLLAYLKFLFPLAASLPGTEAEQKGYLFYQAGILKDDLWNFVFVYGFHGLKQDGSIHKGIEGYYTEQDPVCITLQTLGNLKEVWSEHRTIYMVENPAVFSYLCKQFPSQAFICGNGQLRVAAWAFLDKMKNWDVLWYGGDFDPEGLLIAEKVKKRYPDKVRFWNYTPEMYIKYLSDEIFTDTGRKKLEHISDAALIALREELLNVGKATYQEALLQVYVEDVKKECKQM